MPKPKYLVSDFEKDLLIHELSIKTGIIIKTKKDCRYVAKLVSEKDRFISESTIYRIFVLNDEGYTPYMHTLNVLSEFCNYSGWADFVQKNDSPRSIVHLVGNVPPKNEIKSFLTCSVIANDYKILKSYLIQLPYATPDKHCHIIGNDLFKALAEHPGSCKKLYKELSGVPVIRKSFFELLADPDFELCDYDIGLKYYLKNTSKSSNFKATQDKIFALSLLSRNSFIKNESDFVQNINALKNLKDILIRELDYFDTFPKARCFNYMILYFKGMGCEKDQINYENWLIDFLSDEKNKFNYTDSKIWIHTILDMSPYIIQWPKFENLIHSITGVFIELYPDNIWKSTNQLNLKKLQRYTNPNASAHWKKIWIK